MKTNQFIFFFVLLFSFNEISLFSKTEISSDTTVLEKNKSDLTNQLNDKNKLKPEQIYIRPGVYDDLKKGNQFILKKQYQLAIQILKTITLKEPEMVSVYNKLGYCFLNLGKYNKAVLYYKKANEISVNIDSLAGMQWALMLNKQYFESIAVGKKGLLIDPENYFVRIRIAYSYLQLKQYRKAISTYRKLAEIHGQNAEILYGIGLAQYYLKDYSLANETFALGYKLNPNHAGIRRFLKLPKQVFSIYINPIYQSYFFSDTIYKNEGRTVGGIVSTQFDDYWNMGISFSNDTLSGKDEDENDFDFNVNKFSINLRHTLKDKSSVWFNLHYISSNDKYSDGAIALNVGWSVSNELNFLISPIIFPEDKGLQFTAHYQYRLFSHIYASSSVFGQGFVYSETVDTIVRNRPTTRTVTTTSFYGAFTQKLFFSYSFFVFGVSARFGELYVPLLGNGYYLVSNTETLKTGYSAFISFRYENINLNTSYSRDYWSNTKQETPMSDTFSISMTLKIP